MTTHRTTDPPVELHVRVNLGRLTALQDYARKHDVSMAQATRDAIDALLKQDAEEGEG